MWSVVTALETAVAGPLVGLGVDFVRNRAPSLVYATEDTSPVRLPDKYESMAAYRVRLRNDSWKKVETVTLHLRAGSASLKVDGYSVPAGLQLVQEPDGDGIKIPLPYLKPKDFVRLRVVAHGSYVPDALDINVSSPNKIAIRRVSDFETHKPFFKFTFISFIVVIIILVVFFAFYIGKASGVAESETPPPFVLDQRMVAVAAAADSGLPNLASALASVPNLTYYEAGDLAYSQAFTSLNPEEIDKYRRFITITLATAPAMAPESQANLFYCLGKLDLLRSDEKSALADFKAGITKSKSTVEARLRSDPTTRDFLLKQNLM